jgi:hypothetical protein
MTQDIGFTTRRTNLVSADDFTSGEVMVRLHRALSNGNPAAVDWRALLELCVREIERLNATIGRLE